MSHNSANSELHAINASRNAGVLHRSAVAAADVLALPGTLTLSAITEAGSNLTNVATTVAVSAFNRWGPTGPGTIPGTITPVANQAVRVAFAAVTGADGYDIFLGIGGAALWVGRITEAQRGTGDQIISAVGSVSARAGGTVAGTIDVGIVGTGLSYTVNPFIVNNAFTPATPTPVSCVGFNRAILHVKLSVTDLRSLPTLVLTPFFNDQTSTADWFADRTQTQTMTLLTAAGNVQEQQFPITVDGSTNLVVLVQAITGQGAAASVWVELA